MHDPRVGRFFSVDPLTKEYPHYTPYSFSGNKVIEFAELEGAEEKIVIYAIGVKDPIIFTMADKDIKSRADWARKQVIFYEMIKNSSGFFRRGMG